MPDFTRATAFTWSMFDRQPPRCPGCGTTITPTFWAECLPYTEHGDRVHRACLERGFDPEADGAPRVFVLAPRLVNWAVLRHGLICCALYGEYAILAVPSRTWHQATPGSSFAAHVTAWLGDRTPGYFGYWEARRAAGEPPPAPDPETFISVADFYDGPYQPLNARILGGLP